MDAVLEFVQGALWVPILVIVVLIAAFYFKSRFKTAKADQALVVSGGKKGLRVYPAGGAFVSPFLQFQFFPLQVMTVRSPDQETQTKTLVPVTVRWTAQIRVATEKSDALIRAVQGFSSYANEDEIIQSLQQTLDGEVRAVVATMTPEQVVQDKDSFNTQVQQGVEPRMEALGFTLVSLNVTEVSDRNGHYTNLAAKDRETRRREAETLTAQADQEVAIERAKSDEAAKAAESARDLAVADQNRAVELRNLEIEAEADEARSKAAVAREQQARATAEARREVELTNAETAKRVAETGAQAKARQAEIDAEAAAAVAKAEAQAKADTKVIEAQAEADAIARTTEARTKQTREVGEAEAAVARAQGEAEAAAIRAKGEAEAAVKRLEAEALAAHNGANLQVTLAEIQRDTQITIHTEIGKIMASIGEKATFIDMGGSSSGEGDLFTGVLGRVPELFTKLDVQSNALNGGSFGATLGEFISQVTGKSNSDNGTPEQTDLTVVTQASSPEPAEGTASNEEINVVTDDTESSENELPAKNRK